MSHPCLVVLTARGPARLLEEGGTQAWRLRPESVRNVKYCVCVQNRHNGHWGGADQGHHDAFLIGRISDVVVSPERNDRYLVVFSEYTRIRWPNAWQGHRNPVRYANLEAYGVEDPDNMDWLPMPERAETARDNIIQPATQDEEDEKGVRPLTIAEAKTGLALGLGVPETAIEISIKF